MDDATIDSDDDDDDASLTSLTEEEITAAAIESRDLKLSSLLERKNELPLRTRNKFNDLVFELLTKTKDDIHEMICDNNIDDDGYQGLDSSRDTEAQVETALRIFPEVISQPCWEDGDEDEDEAYPIQRLCNNVKAVSFIALLARLAIYFHSFEDHERGGLLIEDYADDNTFRNLIYYFDSRVPDQNDLIVTVLIRLRRMDLFKKDDIRDYRLIAIMLSKTDEDFSERTFQFLIEWNPTSLLQTDDDGWLLLHCAARYSTIEGFRITFEYGIRYYPYKKGINSLFQKDNDGDTPFQFACQKYGRDKVMEIVEEILTRYHSEGTPLHIVEALMVTSVDENIHLDCSYFLLRREPDVLVRLLSGLHNNNDNDGGGGGGGGRNHNDGSDVDDDNDHDEDEDGDGVGSNDDDDDDDDGGIRNSKNNKAGTRKRKRGGI